MASGGFDYSWVDEPHKRLFCMICNCLFKDAQMLQCTHVMCLSCIRALDESSKERYVISKFPLSLF